MKKIIMGFIFLFILSLSGCNNNDHLTSDFFENEESDDISILWDLVHEYDRFIYESYKEHLGSTYPLEHDTIQHLNEYVPYDQTDKIYKEDMINYELTDNRSYLIEESDIYFYLYVSKAELFAELDCKDIEEGVKCFGVDDNNYLLYYVNENEAYIEYKSIINEFSEHLEKMYYYTNDFDKKVFEYTHYIRNVEQVAYDYIIKTTLIEDEGEVAYTCGSCNLIDQTGWLKYSHVSFFHKSRTYIYQESDDLYTIKLLRGVSQEFYWGVVRGDEVELTLYEHYNGNIKLVEMNPFLGNFKMNLNAIDGWSYIDQAETDHLFQQYNLYDENGMLIDDILVRLAVTEGDFVYYDYDGNEEVVPDDILSMSRFGLEAPYSMEYYLDQEEYFKHISPIILENSHMDRTFDMSYDYFMKMMDIE